MLWRLLAILNNLYDFSYIGTRALGVTRLQASLVEAETRTLIAAGGARGKDGAVSDFNHSTSVPNLRTPTLTLLPNHPCTSR